LLTADCRLLTASYGTILAMTVASPAVRPRGAPKQWIDPPPLEDAAAPLHDHPLVHTLLLRRGIQSRQDADAFLDSRPGPLPDPFLLPDMDRAVERIARAIRDREKIAIFGDYDVDGVTSAAILQLALERLSGDASRIRSRLPTRDEGYGLHTVSLTELANWGASLLVAVDCGSSDEVGVAFARSLGMDVIVVDHHHMTDSGPDAAIVISPARPDAGAYREVSAAGLTLLLVHALEHSGVFPQHAAMGMAGEFLDLAALGIVADVSSMLGANRQLVRDGIRAMRGSPRLGIEALCASARLDPRTMSTFGIGFGLGPRINAAGRLGDPRIALDLLLTNDPPMAQRLAAQLETLNRARQAATEAIVAEVVDRLQSSGGLDDALVLVEGGESWQPGIVGLAAGQLAERLGRPVVLLSHQGEVATGSCRSVAGYSIIEALHRQADMLQRFGGHDQAAGLTIRCEQIDSLREALNDDARQGPLALPIDPSLQIDADLPEAEVTLETARLIMRLSPFGVDNPEPVFRVNGVRILRAETMGSDGAHLRIGWRGRAGEVRSPFFGAGWRLRELAPGRRYDLACTLSVSHWNGPRVEAKVLDFRPAAQG
jgi:single-stranded-DNA-specific exonuclease